MPLQSGSNQWRVNGSVSTNRFSGPSARRYGIWAARAFCLRDKAV